MKDAFRFLRVSLLEGFEPGGVRRLFGASVGLIAFLFPFGLLFVAGDFLPEEFSWTASVVIILNGLAVLLSEMRRGARTGAAGRFAVLILALYCVEWVGVQTGYPFGRYTYTPALGALIAGVPLAIPFAWYATVVNGWNLTRDLLPAGARFLRTVRALTAGVLTVGLDIVLEPLASSIRHYWLWDGGTPPAENYLSWFVFSALIVFWMEGSDRRERGRGEVMTAIVLSGLQLTLFVTADLVHGNIVPVAVAAGFAPFGMLALKYVARITVPGRS